MLLGAKAAGDLGIDVPADAANPCYVRVADAKNAPQFQDFPVAEKRLAPFAKPVLSSHDARMYRTMLRFSATQGPNFAGHYNIAEIGCGTSCGFAAIIDERSGKVSFDPALGVVSGVYVGAEPDGSYKYFRYRTGSRLLIVVGAPNENESRDGLHYYEWTGSSFKPLRFIQRHQACSIGH